MGNVSITAMGLDELEARLEAFGTSLREELAPASQEIADFGDELVASLYGPRLARHFAVVADTEPDAIASVTVFSDEPKVLWWEYGTKAHPIEARPDRPNPHLKFQWEGVTVYRKRVQHPGEKAHNLRFQLEHDLAQNARMVWLSAIIDLMQI